MTTLFPQIKRVDEDETSKIIKNVLFDDHDEVKLEQIFDELTHLTEESITFSDDDEDEDEDDEDEDEDEDDDTDSDSDSSESEDEVKIQTPAAPRGPTSWNLDQFIKTIPIANKTSNHSDNKKPTQEPHIVQIDLSKLKRIPTTKNHTLQPISKLFSTAKALKHEADAEKDKTKQAIKYLEAAMHFILHAQEMETSAKDPKDITEYVKYYIDTITFLKHIMRSSATRSDHQDNMTNLKIHTLCVRCLSIVHMRLYKSRERELLELLKTISSNQNCPTIQQADSLLIGIRPQILSSYEKQLAIYNNLRYANDYWQQADQLCDQHPAVRIFFSTIQSNCGTLTMISQFTKLMDHVKCGLKLLRTS